MEHASQVRHEFLDGRLVEMSGGSLSHSLITMNFGAALHAALVGKRCRALDSNMKVGIGKAARFVYPDISVYCGAVQFDPRDPSGQTVSNPRLIVEVLSPSTEKHDRLEKFDGYMQLESFEEYVLVSQDRPRVETYYRQADGTWLFAPSVGLEATVKFRSLGIELGLAGIYADVEFPAAAEQSLDDPVP